ncbi:hypothetical protein [Streptomyces mirabilis]|uniref:hypothetical protein n=1 Tax=Streptomyces mirabilis TaxID=68239 RepID=UPI0036AC8BB9
MSERTMSERTMSEATFVRTVLGSGPGPGLALAHGAGSSIARHLRTDPERPRRPAHRRRRRLPR